MGTAAIELIHGFKAEYDSLRALAERAVAQVDDEQFFRTLDSEANNIATLMKHVGGNLRSRWRDFRTTDGEKADRKRDSEFEVEVTQRSDIEDVWRAGWEAVTQALDSMTAEDLAHTVVIRGEGVALTRALTRNLAHTAGHVHQVVLLAKHWRGATWKTLSIPRGQSETFAKK